MECKNCHSQNQWIYKDGELVCTNCRQTYAAEAIRLFSADLFEDLPGNTFEWYITLYGPQALHDTKKLQTFIEKAAPYILQSEMTALALFNTIKANEALIMAQSEADRSKQALEIIDFLEKTYFVPHEDAADLVLSYSGALNKSRIFSNDSDAAEDLKVNPKMPNARQSKPKKIRKERKKLSFQLFLKPVIFLLSALILVCGIYLAWQWSLFLQKKPVQDQIVIKNESIDGKDFENALESYKSVTLENCDLEKVSSIRIKKPAVTSLSIESCKNLEDLNWLEECINIKNLRIRSSGLNNNALKELSLKNLIQLENADFSNNELKSLQFLKNCSALISLNVSQNQIKDLKGIRFLKNLNSLDISNNELSTLDTLQSESQNFTLNAQDNKITDIQSSPMVFETLNLDHNPLSKQAALVLLDCQGNSLILTGDETPFVFARNSQIALFSTLKDNQFEQIVFNCSTEEDVYFTEEFGIENSKPVLDTEGI